MTKAKNRTWYWAECEACKWRSQAVQSKTAAGAAAVKRNGVCGHDVIVVNPADG